MEFLDLQMIQKRDKNDIKVTQQLLFCDHVTMFYPLLVKKIMKQQKLKNLQILDSNFTNTH